MNLWIIFKDGEYFGTARDYEAAYRDVDDNIDSGDDDSDAQWASFSIYEYSAVGLCPAPRPR